MNSATGIRELPPLDAHRLWAAEYDSSPNPLLALESRVAIPLLPDLFGCTVLDVASGTGRWARFAHERGASVIALDLCLEMIEQAPKPSVVADSTRLPVRDAVSDVTICAFALGYMGPCLGELARVTKPGGTVLATDVHPEAIARGWTRSFRAGCEVIHIMHRRYDFTELHVPGLELVDLVHAPFAEPERPVFAAAGRAHAFKEASEGFAIFAAKWVRR